MGHTSPVPLPTVLRQSSINTPTVGLVLAPGTVVRVAASRDELHAAPAMRAVVWRGFSFSKTAGVGVVSLWWGCASVARMEREKRRARRMFIFVVVVCGAVLGSGVGKRVDVVLQWRCRALLLSYEVGRYTRLTLERWMFVFVCLTRTFVRMYSRQALYLCSSALIG
ncbi:hypothetical protein DPSP01_010277 [Paraphaeosphaeria sporulosa]